MASKGNESDQQPKSHHIAASGISARLVAKVIDERRKHWQRLDKSIKLQSRLRITSDQERS